MKQRLRQLADRIDRLSLRERVLVFLAVVAVLWSGWDMVLLAPYTAKRDAAQQEIADIRDRVAQLNSGIENMLDRSNRDPNEELRERLDTLDRRMAEIDERIHTATADLVRPSDMPGLLRAMLEKQTDLELLRMASLPPEPLISREELGGEAGDIGNIWRHGLRLEVRGRYLDVLEYVKALEQLEWRFLWGGVEIAAERYPDNRVVIVVNTLSLRENWIGV